MLNKKLALKIFEAFSIERWNDLIRPFEIIEMDKSAEKMVLAYIIGKYEEKKGFSLDWDWIIHASLYELLKKIALCDIKSPVQRMIRDKYPQEYAKLNEWVVAQYEDILSNSQLYAGFRHYVLDSYEETPEIALAKRVLRAAHKYSTMREFEMISPVNEEFRLRQIQRELNEDIEQYLDLRGLQLLITKQKPYEFLMVIEQLRFQTRWNQTPRVPRTSVLGHSFFVAIFTLLLGYESGNDFCAKRRYNNFFSGLFHDLPESVTRDIISPVKQATKELPDVVKKIEEEIVHNQLKPLMDDFFAEELLYFTNDEFSNRIVFQGKNSDITERYPVTHVSFEDMNSQFNSEEFSPIDGRLIRCADHIGAFLEAYSSVEYGITSKHLTEGQENIKKMYPVGKSINGVDIGAFFAEFSE
ncbi:MAG: HD domain-containing protein [Spirochaetaceae bacterium]|nr:HD domain-containing protein [Spirochaetaceae bacterium]